MDHLKLPVLLETIRKGRVLLLNELQAMVFFVIASLSLALWQIIAQAIPLSIPPYCPPAMAIIYSFVYIPSILIAMTFTDDHEGIMKNTPRKTTLVQRPRDTKRLYSYLFYRVIVVVFGIFVTGYITTASVYESSNSFSINR